MLHLSYEIVILNIACANSEWFCADVQGRVGVGGCIRSPVTSPTFCTNEKGWCAKVCGSEERSCSSRYCLGKAGAPPPPPHPHLLPVCLFFSSPSLLPSLPHLHSYLISLCFSTVHHYLFVRSPLSSIILSHRFPSYYRGICLHLSKNNTHTHTRVCAQLCVQKTIAGVLLCAGGAV